MQNKIIFTAVTDPSQLLPLTTKSFDFLQDTLTELHAHFALQFYGPGQSSIAPLFVSVTRTGNIFSNGFFFGGAFLPYWYYLEGGDISGMANPRAVPTFQWYTTTNNLYNSGARPHYLGSPAADSVTFSDNVQRNVHQIRKYTIVDTATLIPGSLDLLGAIQYVRHHQTSSVAPSGSWTGNIGYRFDSKRGTVVLQGSPSILGSGSFGTLPAEIRPVQTRNVSMSFLDDTTYKPGICTIDTGGNITFTSNFAGSTTRTAFMDGVEFHVAN